MVEKAAVVVTVHKPEMNPLEGFSLSRCVDVLGHYPIVLAGPRSLDFTAYRRVAPSAEVVVFDDRYFTSWDNYSEFLTLPPLFEAVASYEFILKYELDAFVFEDQLLEWCQRDWDYIGAPWMNRRREWVGVGNGGFSLRKVGSCLKVLEAKRAMESGNRPARFRRRLARMIARARLGRWVYKYVFPEAQEDVFWAKRAPDYYPAWKVAPVDEAMRFSMETGLMEAASVFRERPPFGCHRDWYVEMLYRYRYSDAQAKSDYEELVWELARKAGINRSRTPSRGAEGSHSANNGAWT